MSDFVLRPELEVALAFDGIAMLIVVQRARAMKAAGRESANRHTVAVRIFLVVIRLP